VVVDADLDERALAKLVETATVRVDDVEPPVVQHTRLVELDRLGMNETKALHGSDRDPADDGHPGSLRSGAGLDLDVASFQLEDVEVAARHVDRDVVDRHAADRALEASAVRVS